VRSLRPSEEDLRGCGLPELTRKIMNNTNSPAESEARVPTDLRKALAAAGKAKVQWSDLTSIARRDFIGWMDSAKQPEEHRSRIEKACAMLAAGKRRP